ncbi:carboxymuconolactone decarboxylase family protein [Kibdelosporangium aridum]|uniref:Carboxymuconolactone decarboxylase family protein n=1 Tax=Kibdelosporangium aridum TaxID=2030 RepID=A0A428Z4T2_KIBAR|nr:carboxymuconolactone decarboxylase family protein [Kibdelosporangium aridum]RSM81647.1 carboxymuconolactone decarboxylase family protein [Kibdelosporangium aridum]
MSPRMTNPSVAIPEALPPLLELTKVLGQVGVPTRTMDLIRLRVSQINGRIYVLPTDLAEHDERLPKVATWRDESCFTDAERAALALAEDASRLNDRKDPVPDEVWAQAAKHYTEQELGALVIQIGLVNLWNCVNVATNQDPADWR